MRAEVPWDRLVPTEDQVRKKYARLPDLAKSIALNGLLQNLVVKRKPGSDGDVFEVRAGERRRRAIGLLLDPPDVQLKKHGELLGCWVGPVPIFIIPSGNDDANIVENIEREDVFPWELGKRLALYNDGGYDVTYIALKIGRSTGYVSQMMTIGRCLSPGIVKALENIGEKNFFSTRNLLKLCRLYDPIMQEPLHTKQLEHFEKMLGTPRKSNKPEESKSERVRVYERAKRLARCKIPGHAKPYVKAIYEYLFEESPVHHPDFNWK